MKYNLSEVTEVIRNRRTIFPEKFSSRKVHQEQIEHMLTNAIWAPTHGMTQPWRFKVFTEGAKTRLGEFIATHYKSNTPADKFKEVKYEKYLNRTEKASAVIAICMQRQESERIPEIEEVQAVACAVQNMHLTCTAYGLGGFWSTGGDVYGKATHEFLELEADTQCLGFFYIGYPDGDWPKGQRRPIEYVTEWINE